MIFRLLVLASVLSCVLVMAGQIHPFPPGMREADELLSLAQLIPSEVQQVQNGRLPKDLSGQLKRIEKLSKHLRRGISR